MHYTLIPNTILLISYFALLLPIPSYTAPVPASAAVKKPQPLNPNILSRVWSSVSTSKPTSPACPSEATLIEQIKSVLNQPSAKSDRSSRRRSKQKPQAVLIYTSTLTEQDLNSAAEANGAITFFDSFGGKQWVTDNIIRPCSRKGTSSSSTGEEKNKDTTTQSSNMWMTPLRAIAKTAPSVFILKSPTPTPNSTPRTAQPLAGSIAADTTTLLPLMPTYEDVRRILNFANPNLDVKEVRLSGGSTSGGGSRDVQQTLKVPNSVNKRL